jgi:hypothetical protein
VALTHAAAARVAAANGGGPEVEVTFPDGETFAPVRVRVRAQRRVEVAGRATRLAAGPEAELAPTGTGGFPHGGGYDGPLAIRQGVPMRPDVALAFDRMEAAARTDGLALMITSGFRFDAEQAVLWARNPDPRWVAPPGQSLTATARSSTSDRTPRTAGWPPTRGGSTSFSVIRKSRSPFQRQLRSCGSTWP